MSEDLLLYTNPMSRGRIVRWLLEEIGEPYEVEVLSFGSETKTPEYLALNPMGKVPTLRHGSAIVTECPAICAYLADAFPTASLAPALDDPARGTYYRWLFFAAGPLEAAGTNKVMGFQAPPDQEVMLGYGTHARVMDALETALTEGPYLCGEQFTAADVYLGSQIGWGMAFDMVERRPAFERYYERLAARPAAQRATELDDALLPPEQRLGI